MNTALNNIKLVTQNRALYETQIISSGTFLPEQRVDSDNLLAEFDSFNRYGIPENFISKKAGITERRFASSTDTPSSMAIKAAQQAIDESGIDADSIGKVVFCGIDKDQAEPATAHTINNLMGLKANDVYDITDACFGFMRAIQDCARSIKLGEITHALVVTGEVPSRLAKNLIDQMKQGVDRATAKKWIGFLTVGDAAGAVILGRADPYLGNGFKSFYTRVDSQHHDLCFYKNLSDGSIEGQMLMGKINAYGRRILKASKPIIKEHPEYSDSDYVLSHNTGEGSFELLCNMELAPRNKMLKLYPVLGNITSATFPVNYHHLNNEVGLKCGDKVAGLFSGSGFVFGHFNYVK